ncbi:hypothetical protein FACS18945_1520 [Bacteroidia bacterium]|nr:hypothetical protein FACS18945_1520 [Bacteroidia bacterium]
MKNEEFLPPTPCFDYAQPPSKGANLTVGRILSVPPLGKVPFRGFRGNIKYEEFLPPPLCFDYAQPPSKGANLTVGRILSVPPLGKVPFDGG